MIWIRHAELSENDQARLFDILQVQGRSTIPSPSRTLHLKVIYLLSLDQHQRQRQSIPQSGHWQAKSLLWSNLPLLDLKDMMPLLAGADGGWPAGKLHAPAHRRLPQAAGPPAVWGRRLRGSHELPLGAPRPAGLERRSGRQRPAGERAGRAGNAGGFRQRHRHAAQPGHGLHAAGGGQSLQQIFCWGTEAVGLVQWKKKRENTCRKQAGY